MILGEIDLAVAVCACLAWIRTLARSTTRSHRAIEAAWPRTLGTLPSETIERAFSFDFLSSVKTFFGGVRAWRCALHLATTTHHILAAAIPECRIDRFAFRLVRARVCEFKSGMSVLVLEPLIDP